MKRGVYLHNKSTTRHIRDYCVRIEIDLVCRKSFFVSIYIRFGTLPDIFLVIPSSNYKMRDKASQEAKIIRNSCDILDVGYYLKPRAQTSLNPHVLVHLCLVL